ncbi:MULTISPECIES: STAS domain-containing protein [Streptomyces]|uniref:STAS domain-containing protein n=1 Tax=Streptomyces TaxID=1883 RepID=UPI0006AE2601|nr:MULTISPECIES: STAS domain-containing protein [unclassified Streptomyces]KOU14952.1 hypothetical protein ADK49_21940 [Streptomyces sp. WM6349]KOU80721.1 hypothetical protein ADK94_28020 [Streptomyces sp. XY593]KOV41293.1 hypothetical protein ADK98_26940 [Streptomyces sp. H036]MCI4079554.1 STAS domain-containing protein [Streptomyces sp. MMS21 TC-5]
MTSTPADLPMPAPGLKTDTVQSATPSYVFWPATCPPAPGPSATGPCTRHWRTSPALLAVDRDAVELFTADGLDLLLALQDTASARGVPLVLVAPSAAVRRVLDVTGTAEAFTISSTIAKATAGYRP